MMRETATRRRGEVESGKAKASEAVEMEGGGGDATSVRERKRQTDKKSGESLEKGRGGREGAREM